MGVDNTSIKPTLVRQIAKFVHHILSSMGFVRDTDGGEFDYDNEASASDSSIDPIMDILMNFRNEIRVAAQKASNKEEIFAIASKVREEALPHIGIKLQDRGPDSSIWVAGEPSAILKEIEEMKAIEAAKKDSKSANK